MQRYLLLPDASISTTTNGELRLGDRVIVSSSRGSKAGTLRYVGVTEFANGVWGGVELDDPLGKNDGSVDGKRYVILRRLGRMRMLHPILMIGVDISDTSNAHTGSVYLRRYPKCRDHRRTVSRARAPSTATGGRRRCGGLTRGSRSRRWARRSRRRARG